MRTREAPKHTDLDADPDPDPEHWYFYIILQTKVKKKSQNSGNQGFSYYFCFMMEGSGSVFVTNGSRCESGGLKTFGSGSTKLLPMHCLQQFADSLNIGDNVAEKSLS
jgi:hypothetical protein